MNSTIKRVCLIFAILLVEVIAGLVFGVHHYLRQPLRIKEASHYYHLTTGATLSQLSRDLVQQGLLDNSNVLTLWGRLSGQDLRIRAGEYQFKKGITPLGLLEQLVNGSVIDYEVKLVEGRTFKEFLSELHQQDKLTKDLSGLSEAQILEKLGLAARYQNVEGLFFPDTYRYRLGDSDIQVLQRAQQRLHDILEQEWQARADKLPYQTAYEALIMASIIEKETGVSSERPLIAGVFIRRLQQGIPLQTDPTVIYGLGDAYRGNLTRQHLQESGPYNTYLNPGLPPTPIAMAGQAAIHAALHPAPGDSLYFVACGDGSHYFSESLDEHQNAVRHYQIKKRRGDYHSTPDSTSEFSSQCGQGKQGL